MKYRREIDGLRALAVVPVVFFHAKLPGFTGGFVGVDIFFVISGFLITSILLKDISENRFSLIDFYERRARRILPALFVVILLCLPFAWMWMLPDDLENFGQSIVAAVLFSNNILLTLTTGYWDLAGEFKPLLHTWSLGVEEQFYLFFPLTLLVAWRFFRHRIALLISIIGLISFLLFLTPHFLSLDTRGNAAVFYTLPTRAWQLLLGTFAAIYVSKSINLDLIDRNGWLANIGFMLIIAALFVPFPEHINLTLKTILASVGSILILIFTQTKNLTKLILSNRVMVSIGLISYSVYLYHQPLLALTRIYVTDEPKLIIAIPIILTFVLATISYFIIERPFRDKSRISTPFAIGVFTFIGGLLISIGFLIYAKSGFPQRIEAIETERYKESIAYNQRAFNFLLEQFPDKDGQKILVLGNSFGRDMVSILLEALPLETMNLVYRDDHYDCFKQNNDPKFRSLLSQAEIVLLSSSVLPNPSCVESDIRMMTEKGTRLFYIGTKHFGYNLNWIIRNSKEQRADLTNALLPETIEHENTMSSMIPHSHYISILDQISKNGRIPITDHLGRVLSPDRTHLTRAGAEFIAQAILNRTPLCTYLNKNDCEDQNFIMFTLDN